MEIERNEEKKIISVWLTRAESRDEDLHRRLKAMYPKWKKENIWLLSITPARRICTAVPWICWPITRNAAPSWQ